MEENSESNDQEELYEHHRLDVDKGQAPLRIDKFLMNRLEHTSRNRIQNAALAGSILVNQKAVKSNYKVKPGDVVSIVLAHPPREIELYADNVPIKIVYEDTDIIVVDKDAGMVVHPAYGNYRNTLVNALCYHLHPQYENKVIPEGITRPGLVHRIDKDTSGLLLVAKNETAMTFLAKQFYDKTVDRNYLALVWGDFEELAGTITGNVGRNLKDRKIMDVFKDGKLGKHAVTHYEVLIRFGYVTLVKCKLETGRTHQIRVHFKSIKHPLFNDATYGGNRILKGTRFTKYKAFVNNCFDILPRQALHAHTLGFIHPKNKEKMTFTSELPIEFEMLIEKWKNYINVMPAEMDE